MATKASARSVRWRLTIGVVHFAACVFCAAGCESHPEPDRPLNVDERAQLLREIRSDRSRMQNLTPREREYMKERLSR